MMPNESGIDFLKRSQSVLKTPVIMLTALGDVDDRINGLESGADDYLSKPFEPKELLLRAKKLLSRNKDKKQYNLCIFGEYTFDIEKSQLTKNMQHIHLTTNESRMLQALAKRTGEIISREEMQEYFDDVNIRTIDVAIARLRNKIEGDNKTPQYLQTIRNQGYVLWGNLE
jgi:two-component system phosphate regulon response regulator OmpR